MKLSKSLLALTCLLIGSSFASSPALAGSSGYEACADSLSRGSNKKRVKVNKDALLSLFAGVNKYDSKTSNDNVALLIDYSLPSTAKRAYLVDIKSCDILENEYVIHGGAVPKQGAPSDVSSRDGMLLTCKNSQGTRTNMTRPGFMRTAGWYTSPQAWPELNGNYDGIVLQGLESRNDDVQAKSVVLHEHKLIPNRDSVKPVGQGCPGFPTGKLKNMLRYDILQGTLVYIHAPQCK